MKVAGAPPPGTGDIEQIVNSEGKVSVFPDNPYQASSLKDANIILFLYINQSTAPAPSSDFWKSPAVNFMLTKVLGLSGEKLTNFINGIKTVNLDTPFLLFDPNPQLLQTTNTKVFIIKKIHQAGYKVHQNLFRLML